MILSLENLAKLIGGNPWGESIDKPRIYMPSKHRVFFSFPDYPTGEKSDPLGGAKFNVWIEGETIRAVIVAKQNQLYRDHYKHSLALEAARWEWGLAEQIMRSETPLDRTSVDVLSADLINGRLETVRSFFSGNPKPYANIPSVS